MGFYPEVPKKMNPREIEVVTSCSLKGFDQYGRKFTDTFHKFWPADVTLHVVSEDNLPISPMISGNRKLSFWDLYGSIAIAKAFHDEHIKQPRSHGRGMTDHPGRSAGHR